MATPPPELVRVRDYMKGLPTHKHGQCRNPYREGIGLFGHEEAQIGSIRAYIRVSTEEQAQQGFSLQTQRTEISQLIRYKWPDAHVDWYEDDGWSAKDTKRPALQRLRAHTQPGDLVICLRLDRLTRSVYDLYTMLTEWDKRGIRFRSVREDYDTSTASGKFMIGLLALLAQWERERIAERVREVMVNVVAKEKRHVSKPPLGYDLVQKSLVVNEKEAALVRRVFALYVAGKGTRAIALALNAEGLRTKGGAEWTDFAVNYVLTNPVYTGKVAWGRIVQHGKRRRGRTCSTTDDEMLLVDGVHEPIIATATWQAVQELKGQRRQLNRAATGPHPLSGIARCGLCGGPMHGFVQRRYAAGAPIPGKERAYYRCSNRNHKDNCRLPYMPSHDLEAKVLDAIGVLGDKATLDSLVADLLDTTCGDAHAGRIDELRAELKRLERKRHRWDSLYEEGDLSKAEWRERTAELRRQVEEKRAALAAVSPLIPVPVDAAAVAEALAELPLVWQALEPEEQKMVLQGLVEKVVVHVNGNVTVVPRPRRLRQH